MDNNYEPRTDSVDISVYMASGFSKVILATSAFGLLLGGFLVSVFAR